MKQRRPPWRNPLWLAWLAAAGLLSFWLALNMPHTPRQPAPSAARALLRPVDTAAVPAKAAARPERAEGAETGDPDRRRSAADAGSDAASPRTDPRTNQRATHPGATHEGIILAELARALKRLSSFAGLFGMVGVGSILGSVAESRRWHLVLGRHMQGLARAARLPDVVGLAMPAALLSNAAANGMLASSHANGEISRSALIAGGMANSYLAHASHSIRVMYPVIAAVGLPGALYFGGQLTGGFLFVLGVLAWNRHSVGAAPRLAGPDAGACAPNNAKGTEAALPKAAPLSQHAEQTAPKPLPPLPWKEAFRRALTRTAALLFRMACITVPLALGVEWLLKNGAFDFWERLAPAWAARLFPAELVSIVAAQMGGLVQSASLAAHLRAEGLVDNPRILLAMLAASAIGNPFRMLRRNLPSALGLFPPAAALAVALGMQAARLCITLALIALVIVCLPVRQAG